MRVCSSLENVIDYILGLRETKVSGVPNMAVIWLFCLLHIEILWRDWEDLSVQPCELEQASKNPPLFEFRVMSYNILAQDLVEQGHDLYIHCHPDILNWDYRLPNILQEIQHWDPDVSMTEPLPHWYHQNFNFLCDLTACLFV